jgi:hypothetical protein
VELRQTFRRKLTSMSLRMGYSCCSFSICHDYKYTLAQCINSAHTVLNSDTHEDNIENIPDFTESHTARLFRQIRWRVKRVRRDAGHVRDAHRAFKASRLRSFPPPGVFSNNAADKKVSEELHKNTSAWNPRISSVWARSSVQCSYVVRARSVLCWQ